MGLHSVTCHPAEVTEKKNYVIKKIWICGVGSVTIACCKAVATLEKCKVTGYSSSQQASPLRELTCHIKSNQIKFICDKNKHNVTHTKTNQVCRQDTKAV